MPGMPTVAGPTPQAGRGASCGLAPMRVITVARKPLEASNVAANLLRHGTGAIHVDATRIATSEDTSRTPSTVAATAAPFGVGLAMGGRGHAGGRWPSNLVLGSQEAAADLDAQSGTSKGSTSVKDPKGSLGYHGGASGGHEVRGHGDSGCASRYFKRV